MAAKSSKKAFASVPARLADGEVVGRACPICQTQVVRGENVVACPACKLDYHHECWTENAGCGAYGCEWAPETIKQQVPEHEVHWEGDKQCPACGRKIKAQALLCLHCKVHFWTRDPISREAWQNREFQGHEANAARNVLIGVFILSTCGCLFPLTALLTGAWIWGNLGPYPFVRLPDNLKMLLKASFGASCLWGFIFVAVMLAGH